MGRPLNGDPFNETDEEPPLDPAMARVQDKLRRMLLVSGLTLGLGLVAVLFAILYRINNAPVATPERFDSVVELPAGAEVLETSLDGNRILFRLDVAGERLIRVYDLSTGAEIGQARLVAR